MSTGWITKCAGQICPILRPPCRIYWSTPLLPYSQNFRQHKCSTFSAYHIVVCHKGGVSRFTSPVKYLSKRLDIDVHRISSQKWAYSLEENNIPPLTVRDHVWFSRLWFSSLLSTGHKIKIPSEYGISVIFAEWRNIFSSKL